MLKQCKGSLLQMVIVALSMPAMEAQTQCSSATEVESSARIGESVYFYICGASDPNYPLTVELDSGDLYVDAETLTEGWHWESIGSGDDSYINITFMITAAGDYGTYRIIYIKTGIGATSRDLTISHKGPPQLCETEDPSSVHTLSAPIGSSDSSTLRVVSGSALTLSKIQLQTCQERTTDTPTFGVTAVQNTSITVVYELEFLVSNLTVADIGQWTVTVDNDDGSFTIEINVEAVGPPLLCGVERQTLEMDYCSNNSNTVLIYSRDVLALGTIERVSNETTLNCPNSLNLTFGDHDPITLTQDLKLEVTCDDISTWTVPVNNFYGTKEINVHVADCVTHHGSVDHTILITMVVSVAAGVLFIVAAALIVYMNKGKRWIPQNIWLLTANGGQKEKQNAVANK